MLTIPEQENKREHLEIVEGRYDRDKRSRSRCSDLLMVLCVEEGPWGLETFSKDLHYN